MTIEIDWQPGRSTVAWTHGGARVEKTLAWPPSSVTAWQTPPRVIVVEPLEQAGRQDNAVVFDADGHELLRLVPPQLPGEPSWRLGFHTVYVSQGTLVAVFSTRVGDFWGTPDLTTGELRNVTEWR
jgi:hypothetical protein